MFICHLSLTRGWTNDRSTWLVNNKLKSSTEYVLSFSHILCHIPVPLHPVTYHLIWMGMFWNAHHTSAKADLFSQELQICFTWNILYFEHNPLNTLSTFCMFIYFPFSQVSPLPRSELLMHFDKLNSSRVQPIQTYRYDGVIFSNDQARIANFMFHDI